MASLISSTVWVKRGLPAQHPKRYNLDEDELARVSRLAGNRLAQVKELLDQQVEAEEEIVDVEEMIAGEEEEDQDQEDHNDEDMNKTKEKDEDQWSELSNPRQR
jgi:periodic tryptophan protein 1